MKEEPGWHPDLLRRFVPSPYVFRRCEGSRRLFVESNDLEIALGVRRAAVVQRRDNRALFCKLIRDVTAPAEDSDMTVFSDGMLRVLQFGRGTILIHDYERSELFGFVACNVQVEELVSSLIPTLLDV